MSGTRGLVVDEVRHSYGAHAMAVDGLDFVLSPGVTALVGVNGAGKSTTLRIMAGAQRPSEGRVLLDGADLYASGRRHLLPRISLMPQHLTLPKGLTVYETLGLLAWSRGVPRKRVPSAVERAIELVDLGDKAQVKVERLSGGMARRVHLAQAVVAEPDVVLLDEPSTGLDPEQRRKMVDLIRQVPGSVLFSSHVMEDVVEVATHLIVLDGGRVVFDGLLSTAVAGVDSSIPTHRAAEVAFFELISRARDHS